MLAGAGALITVAGLSVAKKVKQYFANRYKMRTVRHNLLLSARCAWLLSELGVDNYAGMANDEATVCTTDDSLLSTTSKHNGRLVRQESEYQVVVYSPCISCEDLTVGYCYGDSVDGASYGSLPGGVIDDDFTMIESAALCLYLADLYGRLVAEPQHRAEYYSWIVYSSATFDSLVKTIRCQLMKSSTERDELTLESALRGFHAFARAVNDTLSVTNYLCGNRFTAADCVLGFTLFCANTVDGGRLLNGYPAISTYLCRLHSRPAFQRTFCSERLDYNLDMSHYLNVFMPQICNDN